MIGAQRGMWNNMVGGYQVPYGYNNMGGQGVYNGDMMGGRERDREMRGERDMSRRDRSHDEGRGRDRDRSYDGGRDRQHRRY